MGKLPPKKKPKSEIASLSSLCAGAAQKHKITLTPQQQTAFWLALQKPVKLTARQKKLAALMRGEA